MNNFWDVIINAIGSVYADSKNIYNIIGTILSIVVLHKAFYFVIGMFFTRKFKEAKVKHKYGIVIAARNEKYVIGNLLDSINKQDYPKDMLTVFVVADNCTDNTAEIARSKGEIHQQKGRTGKRGAGQKPKTSAKRKQTQAKGSFAQPKTRGTGKKKAGNRPKPETHRQ